MKAVADTLAVARSNLIERVSGGRQRADPIARPGMTPLLALIRRLWTSVRPTGTGVSRDW